MNSRLAADGRLPAEIAPGVCARQLRAVSRECSRSNDAPAPTGTPAHRLWPLTHLQSEHEGSQGAAGARARAGKAPLSPERLAMPESGSQEQERNNGGRHRRPPTWSWDSGCWTPVQPYWVVTQGDRSTCESLRTWMDRVHTNGGKRQAPGQNAKRGGTLRPRGEPDSPSVQAQGR